jgi:Uma2 family endonuclease
MNQDWKTELSLGVDWERFESILERLGDNRTTRVAYNRGTMEARKPSSVESYYKEVLSDLIKYLALDVLNIDCESFGSSLWMRKDLLLAIEPDACFYLQNEPAIRGVKPNIELPDSPPPDLVLHADDKASQMDKQVIYQEMGVPELWLYSSDSIRVLQLQDGEYNETETSLTFPVLPIRTLPQLISDNIVNGVRKVIFKAFRDWLSPYISSEEGLEDYLDVRDAILAEANPGNKTRLQVGEVGVGEWLRASASNPAFDFLKDPEEDIYTLEDGMPFSGED